MLKYIHMKKWNNFYGSIFNSILLLILICLMIVALYYMRQNPDIYFPGK